MTGRPIGIFDSGLGGLSVAREVRLLLPGEDILYIADSAYVPYGGRSFEEISSRSLAVTRALVESDAKLIVVACNTASGAAIELIRDTYTIPIVGLEPAVKPAAASTRTGRIAVLATPATLQTPRFHRLVDNHGPGIDVVKIPCPGFVELVESGELAGDRAVQAVEEALAPLAGSDVDRVVLGCTHYPFLREVIATVVGPQVEILDSGAAVARQVRRVLHANGLLREGHAGSFTFLTTGDPAVVAPTVQRLWGEPVEVGHIPA